MAQRDIHGQTVVADGPFLAKWTARIDRTERSPAPESIEIEFSCENDKSDRLCFNLRMHEDTRRCGLDPDSEFVELAVEVFSMLADATRVRMVLALRSSGEMSVNHLADVVEKSPAAVSQHLAKLRLARMVTTRQDGTRVFYRLADEHASDLVSDAVKQAEHSISNGTTPRHHHPIEEQA
jgi:DNA-binding transcriptional ArsR family regulator